MNEGVISLEATAPRAQVSQWTRIPAVPPLAVLSVALHRGFIPLSQGAALGPPPCVRCWQDVKELPQEGPSPCPLGWFEGLKLDRASTLHTAVACLPPTPPSRIESRAP